MEKFKQLQKIKEIYRRGENIIEYLNNISNDDTNSIEDILISYEFQSGSYIRDMSKNKKFINSYANSLSTIIDKIDNVKSIIEVGVGEATTLLNVIRNLNNKPSDIFGFDISWSRLKFAKELLSDNNIHNVNIINADLFQIPLLDNSIDIVYTSHSIEPNGGKEEEALKELFRITNKYLILLEPSYEFANNEAKARMKKHGYITELYSTALKLGYNIIEHRVFDHCSNPLNPTGLMIIKKEGAISNKPKLVCPITHTKLIQHNESFLYSKEGFLVYPILEKIPCLRKENSILAAHLLSDYNELKKENEI